MTVFSKRRNFLFDDNILSAWMTVEVVNKEYFHRCQQAC